MGKQIGLLLLLAMLAVVSTAQEKWRAGAKVGIPAPSMLGNANAQFKVGYNAGLAFEYNIRDGYQFQPQLVYTSWGAQFEIENQTAHLQYAQLALMNRFTPFNNRFIYTSIGPYVGYLLSKSLSEDNEYSFQSINKIDVGLSIAGGYEFKIGGNHRLLAQVDYSLAVRPVFDEDDDDTNEYNHAPGLSLIYLFAL